MDDSRNLPVLAGPERRRQLRELLAMPKGSWTAAQRQRYGELVQWEYLEYLKNLGDIALDVEREQRQGLVNFLSRPGQPQPVVQRIDATMPSEGEVLRDRNRRIREAREAFDGHTVAALEGRIAECIVCGKPLPKLVNGRRRRSDAAYCPGGSCRQKALRLRKQRQP